MEMKYAKFVISFAWNVHNIKVVLYVILPKISYCIFKLVNANQVL